MTDEIKAQDQIIEVDICPKCEGIWFDQGELDKVDKNIKPSLIEFRKIPDIEVQLESLICPNCKGHKKMKKIEHDRDSHVIIDSCTQCGGIWLDKGELHAIINESVGSIMIGYFKKAFDKKKKSK